MHEKWGMIEDDFLPPVLASWPEEAFIALGRIRSDSIIAEAFGLSISGFGSVFGTEESTGLDWNCKRCV